MDLESFLKRVPLLHLKYVRDLAIDFGERAWLLNQPFPGADLPVKMQMAGQLNLRNLTMRIREKIWTVGERILPNPSGPFCFDERDIPGVAALAELRGLDDVRMVDGPKLEAYLRSRMLEPRPGPHVKKKAL
jgi:hypothetical protein